MFLFFSFFPPLIFSCLNFFSLGGPHPYGHSSFTHTVRLGSGFPWFFVFVRDGTPCGLMTWEDFGGARAAEIDSILQMAEAEAQRGDEELGWGIQPASVSMMPKMSRFWLSHWGILGGRNVLGCSTLSRLMGCSGQTEKWQKKVIKVEEEEGNRVCLRLYWRDTLWWGSHEYSPSDTGEEEMNSSMEIRYF